MLMMLVISIVFKEEGFAVVKQEDNKLKKSNVSENKLFVNKIVSF